MANFFDQFDAQPAGFSTTPPPPAVSAFGHHYVKVQPPNGGPAVYQLVPEAGAGSPPPVGGNPAAQGQGGGGNFFDQFDNATRLEGLGVSRTLALRDYAASALVPLLESVRGDRRTQEQCRAIRNRMADGDATDHICALIGAATVSPAGPV